MWRKRLTCAVLAAATVVLAAACNPVAGKPSTSPTTTSASSTSSSVSATSAAPPSSTPATAPASVSAGGTASTTTAPAKNATTTVADTQGWACTIGITRVGSGDAVMQGTVDIVTFTNTGNTACRLAGGANAQFVDAAGRGVGAPAALGGGTNLLEPGQAVTARLKTTITGVFDEDRCAAVPITGVRFIPPAYAAPTELPSSEKTACSNGGQMAWLDSLPSQSEGP